VIQHTLNQNILEYMINLVGVLYVKYGLNFLQLNALVVVRYLEQNQNDHLTGKNI